MANTAVILGARGRFGLAAARAFADAGWRVLAQTRPGARVPGEVQGDARLQWLGVELNDTAALAAAAQGATVVVHALNPAYTHKAWRSLALPMLDSAIALASALGATLMLPGNVYNFGVAMPAVLDEDTPQLAQTVKGRIRTAMEQRLQRSGVRSVVVRAGDFFGSGRGTWFDLAMVKDLAKGRFAYPGQGEVATAWAYLPDLARTFVELANRREQLQDFDVFHFAVRPITGEQWRCALEPLAREQGWIAPGAALKRVAMPWGFMRMLSWLVPTWAALLEMRYLWNSPYALANGKLTVLIGAEPHTPLALAVRTALGDLGMVAAPRLQPLPESVRA